MGYDHSLLKLPFVSKINLCKEFTLYDLLVTYTNLIIGMNYIVEQNVNKLQIQ